MAVSNWRELPLDLGIAIAEKIKFYEDVEAFAGVCSCWRHAAYLANRLSSTHTPWLMLAEPPRTSKRRFYSLYNSKVRLVDLPAPPTTQECNVHKLGLSSSLLHPPKEYKKKSEWRYFSSRGWLICVTQVGLDVILMHPLSGKMVKTPALPETVLKAKIYLKKWHDRQYLHLFHKFALSESPSITEDYTLAMITTTTLAFWRSGDKEWIVDESYYQIHHSAYMDVTFYKGEFYAIRRVGGPGFVQVVACGKASPWTPRVVIEMGSAQKSYADKYYLVESDGVLLLVTRLVNKLLDKGQAEYAYKTESFMVRKVNIMEGVLTLVNGLGNRALFVGFNSSFSVETSYHYIFRRIISQHEKKYYCMGNCTANCIYYTDDLLQQYYLSQGGHDMGVYSLIFQEKIEDFYKGPSCFSVATPPLWLETPKAFHSSCICDLY